MRSKLWLLAGIALAGALALYGATQVWVALSLASGAAASERLEVTGQQLNQSLSPIAIAALASALALTIAGPAFRRLLGALVVLLGAGISAIAISVLRDPQSAATGRLAEATGLAGSAQADLVTAVDVSLFAVSTLAAGLALAVLGLLVLLLAGRWRSAGRKYDTDAARSSSSGGEPDRISDWEAMNDGQDPSGDGEDEGDAERSERSG